MSVMPQFLSDQNQALRPSIRPCPPNTMKSNQRLLSATLFSSCNAPYSMTVRTSHERGNDSTPTLAAIASSMCITIVDILVPQHPWMVLNYASFNDTKGHDEYFASSSKNMYHGYRIQKGITTMAFQPSPIGNLTSESRTSEERCSASSILLATARGSGILIWDCSGRALSPLVGLLNTADSFGSPKCNDIHRNNQLSNLQSEKGTNGVTNQIQIPPPPLIDLMPHATSAINTNNVNNTTYLSSILPAASTNQSCGVGNSNASNSIKTNQISERAATSYGSDLVTSLAWKGSSAPILLATAGASACLFDLRMSLFSGVNNFSGARPNSRFLCPDSGSILVDCSYSHDETLHMFSTIDCMGIVSLWDDRKCSGIGSTPTNRCLSRFVAHPHGAVGIRAIPPSKQAIQARDNSCDLGSRWLTWGLDEVRSDAEASDDLVAKLWESTPLRSEENGPALSPVSMDGDGLEETEESIAAVKAYQVTTRFAMSGAVAARINPSFPDGVFLFKSPASSLDLDFNSTTTSRPFSSPNADGAVVADARGKEVEALNENPNSRTKEVSSSPIMPISSDKTHTKSSPLRIMNSQEINNVDETSATTSYAIGGWEAELWKFDVDNDEQQKDTKLSNLESRLNNARKIASFRGGGVYEDALSLAPGGREGDMSDIIAVDLAVTPRCLNAMNQEELLLCCLTKAGKMCTYRVPEANELHRSRHLRGSDITSHNCDLKKTVLTECNSSKPSSTHVYRRDDSSSWWNHYEEGVFGASNSQSIAEKIAQYGEAPPDTHTLPERIDRAVTQFDIDIVTAPVIEKMTDLTTPAELSDSLRVDGEISTKPCGSHECEAVNAADLQSMPIDMTKATFVPCPPLCGVAFAGGAGGLVAFDNGPVKRMWSWHQANEVSLLRLKASHSPVIRSCSVSDSDRATNIYEINDESDCSRDDFFLMRETPRTLFDLIEMNTSAKAAQWGLDLENNESNDNLDSSNKLSSSSSSDEYDDAEQLILDSDDSDRIESDDSEGFHHVSRRKSLSSNFGNRFNDYFASSRKSLTRLDPDPNTHKSTEGDAIKSNNDASTNERFLGFTSISPSVLVTRTFDKVLLNGQNQTLAQKLYLGDAWWLSQDFTLHDVSWIHGQKTDNGWDMNASLPHNTLTSHASMLSQGRTAECKKSSSYPNESSAKQLSMMGNLKKLFSYQSPSIAMTPPDQRLLKRKKQNKIAPYDHHTGSFPSNKNVVAVPRSLPHGVFVCENQRTPPVVCDRLAITRNFCSYNAKIYSDFGEKAKSDTWTLLAKIIDSMISYEADDFNGWGGQSDALSTGAVEEIIRYYEKEGEYQMLSTIVSVLTLGRDRRRIRNDRVDNFNTKFNLLPKFDDRRYDNYLHRYSAILYGWGMLTLRNEIAKRLAYAIPGAGGEVVTHVESKSSSRNNGHSTFDIVSNPGVAPGITFNALCQRCMTPVTYNDICNNCEDYAFQCSICCSAVRGACTWCPFCGHGGHLQHIISWFDMNKACPTGCGCMCMVDFTS